MAISIFNKTSIFLLSITFLLVTNVYGQSINNYAFSVPTGGTYTALSETPLTLSGGTADEGFYNDLLIGFDFWYMGAKHTTFSVSTNGFMALSQSLTSAVPINELKSSSARNVIAPLWDDLAVVGDVQYSTVGVEGSRILTIQWRDMQWNTTSASRMSFQVRLYEATGAIRFSYWRVNVTAPANTASASIGISGPNIGQFASVTSIATPTANYTNETNTISTKPANNTNYQFLSAAVAGPTNLQFTAVGPNHLTLNWNDVATDNIGYVIHRSTNQATGFSQIGTMLGSNATTYTDTGLDQMKTYYYKVYAVRESLSAPLSGSSNTIISCLATNPTGAVANYKLDNNATDVTTNHPGTLQGTSAFTTDRFGVGNRAYSLNGSTSFISTANAYTNPQNFTLSLWFRTITTEGGVMLGFAENGTSTAFDANAYKHDRMLYMAPNGRIYFGIYTNPNIASVNTATPYNDGRWHQLTAVLGSGGMSLYLDGAQVGTSITPKPIAENFNGYWRIGQTRVSSDWDGWQGTGDRKGASKGSFKGELDDIFIYNSALTNTQVKEMYPATLTVNSTGPVCAGYPFNLTAATTFAGATYQWTRPDGTTFSGQNHTGLVLNNASVGVYKVSVTSATGCVTTSATRVGFTNSPGQWAGKFSIAWANPDNWCAGLLPTAAVNVTIPTSGPTFNPTLTTVGLSDSITVESNRALTISGSGDLQVAGTITKAATGIITAAAGKVTMNGNIAQVIPANIFANNLIKDLTLDNTAGVTLNDTLRLTGVLTPSAGIFQTGGNLTLASSETATASVATIPANASVRGSVKVERFLKGGAINPYRTYRMLSSPVYDNTTDFVNTNEEGNRSAKFSQLIDDMIISGANGVAGGFDVTHNNQASAWTYSGGFTPITNINTAVNAGRGMYVFFRGNRSNFQAKTNAPYTNPEDLVMDFDGVLNQQDVTVTLPNGGSFLGNPYAATIDWDSGNLVKTNLNNAIWIWNPQKRSYATYKNGFGLLGGSRYIASGQSFFVQTNVAGAGLITFKESIKATSQQPPALLMAAPANSRVGFSDGMTLQNFDKPRSLLRISMKPLASYGEDETVVVFNEGSSAAFDEEDATHIDGEVVNITTLAGTKKLAINFHAPVIPLMDIPVHVNAAATGIYTLKFNIDEYFAAQDLLLKDNYLNKVVPITSNLVYSFNIDKSIAQTFGANRFSIAAATPAVLPVILKHFTANKQIDGVSLNWKVTSESNLKHYQIFRAASDGVFLKLGEVDADGNGNYTFLDSQPHLGLNYYNLKLIDLNGKQENAGSLSVVYELNERKEITVYPNPALDQFAVKIPNLQTGKFEVEIFALSGQKIISLNTSAEQLAQGFEVGARELESGIFIIKVKSLKNGEIIAVEKLIKQ